MSNSNSGDRRKRGIKASRQALSQALLVSNLKTQTALAVRIADLEGLESPPRDSVGRAFREQPVDPLTLTRIARALDVPVHTLYLTSRQPPLATLQSRDAATVVDSRWRWPPAPGLLWTFAGVLAAAVVLVGSWLLENNSAQPAAPPATAALEPRLDAFTLAIAPLPGDADGALGRALRATIAPGVRVSTASANLLVGDGGVVQILRQLRTDLVLTATRQPAGRFVTYSFDWYAAAATEDAALEPLGGRLWLASLPLAAEAAELEALGVAAGKAFNALIGEREIQPHLLDGAAHHQYLEGRSALYRETGQHYAHNALRHFDAAISLDPQHAEAHAGRCMALLLGSWHDNEQQAVIAAEPACAKALTLQPDSAYVASAHGYFLRKSGRVSGAVNYLREQMMRQPHRAELHAGMGAALINAYLQGDAGALPAGLASLQRATELDPDHWRWHSLLATAAFYAGDLPLAIAQGTLASAADDHEVVLANLGTAHFCQGDFAATLDTYLRLQRAAPDNYLAKEYIGLARYYQGDFAAAVTLRRGAIASIGANGAPEVHAMWGNLADALRHTGEAAEALDAYRRAAAIVERDFLAGNAAFADHAHRAYYYAMVAWLSDTAIKGPVGASIEADLLQVATDPATAGAAGNLRAALTWQLLGQPQRGTAARDHAVAICAGFALHPDYSEQAPHSLQRLQAARSAVN